MALFTAVQSIMTDVVNPVLKLRLINYTSVSFDAKSITQFRSKKTWYLSIIYIFIFYDLTWKVNR